MNPHSQKVLEIFEERYRGTGPALIYRNSFELLVATLLSAQTTDMQVNRITAPLFAKYPTPAELAALTEEKLAEEIKGCGLYRNKAKNLVATARLLLEKHAGKVPKTREELMELPGIGRKTANVILANAFGIPAFGVDTHVFRVANRLALTESKNPLQTEEQLTAIIPREKWSAAHHWFIWHGRKICKAKKPLCPVCPVGGLCPGNNTKKEVEEKRR